MSQPPLSELRSGLPDLPKPCFSLGKQQLFHFARPTDSDRPRDRQIGAHGDTSAPLCSSAPCPISLKSTFLNHTSRKPGNRLQGAHLTPTPDPSRGRRIDWPAATAADPEKERWTPIATVVATFSDAGLRSLPSTSRFQQRAILNTTNHFWNRKLHRGSLSRTVVAFFDIACYFKL